MTTASDLSSFDDPIVEEIRKVRAELAREAGYDLHLICERLREAERQHPERMAAPKSTPIGR
jgi:hypothetical protein